MLTNGNSNVSYEYVLKNSINEEINEVYEWKTDEFNWSACNKSCNKGFTELLIDCIEVNSNLQVDESNCDKLTKPSKLIKPCNVIECYPEYKIILIIN